MTFWELFKSNWKNCVFGAGIYCLKHPIFGPRLIYHRLQFAIGKRDFNTPLMVPEHFTIWKNSHLLCYTQIYVERNLYHPVLMRALADSVNPLVVDVGYNTGMFTRWIHKFNRTACFIGFEPSKEYRDAAIKMNVEACCYTKLEPVAVSNVGGVDSIEFANDNLYFTEGRVKDTRIIPTVTLDSYLSPVYDKPFLIKIDTDGFNHKVLLGAENILRHTRFVLVEHEHNCDLAEFFPSSHWNHYPLAFDSLYEKKTNT